jgi:hypothetical protein
VTKKVAESKVAESKAFIMAGHSRLENGVASLAYVPAIHVLVTSP